MMRLHRGFTLIELLIVMVIISVISGIAVMTLSHNQHRAIEVTAKQIEQQLLLAEEEAMLRPATLGLAITPQGMQWYRYQETTVNESSHWQRITERPFAEYRFHHSLALTLRMHDEVIPLSDQPVIIVSMNGDITPFVLSLGQGDQPPHIKLVGESSGGINSEIIDA